MDESKTVSQGVVLCTILATFTCTPKSIIIYCTEVISSLSKTSAMQSLAANEFHGSLSTSQNIVIKKFSILQYFFTFYTYLT